MEEGSACWDYTNIPSFTTTTTTTTTTSGIACHWRITDDDIKNFEPTYNITASTCKFGLDRKSVV